MTNKFRGWIKLVGVGSLLVAIAAGALLHRKWKSHLPVVMTSNPPPTSQPVIVPASSRAADVKNVATYLDVVRSHYPEFPTTQALILPLDLSQAAHLIIRDPIFLSGAPTRQMWITRSDAPPTDSVLKEAVSDKKEVDTHVLRERVAFVHWMPTENGNWPPYLVCRNGVGGYELISAAHGKQALPRQQDYHWDHAISWNEKVVVPTSHGVSVFRFGPEVIESYHELAPPGRVSETAAAFAEPRILLDWQGLIAWIPWEEGKVGSRGGTRYVEPLADDLSSKPHEGKWIDFSPDNGYPEKILHLVPLLDGTVMMLTVDDHGAAQVQFNTFEQAQVKDDVITKLVDDLSDTDEKVRTAAYDKLSQYGSGIWPILEKLLPDQGPEAQARMRQLLKQKVTPTLNGMILLGNKSLKLEARLGDGGTVFYAPAGVSIPDPQNPDAGPDYRVPAWISIRPGRPIELLPALLTADLVPGQSKVYADGNDWIVTQDARGPRRFVGNGFVTFLRKSDVEFSDFVGSDARGRWLFRKPPISSAASTLPATGASPATTFAMTQSATMPGATAEESADTPTLIIDPLLPDPTPRLPVWVFKTAESVGWTQAGWPVAKNNSRYALHENDWQLLDENEKMDFKPEDVPPQIEPVPTTSPSTAPSTLPSTLPATQTATAPASAPTTVSSRDEPILTDRDGNRYFGGLTDLRVVSRAGTEVTWLLPAIAIGQGPAWLVRTPNGRLFLFNQPGRVLRIKPTPDKAEPFALEKIFTHRIPTVEHPTRIWLDPAGRIIMAWENQLAILFPAGYVPPAIAEKMLAEDTDEDE